MNKIFKSIWNEQTGTYVAVSENTRSKGKKSSSTLCTALAVALGAFSLSAQAWEWHISDGTNQNSISTFLTGQTATFSGDGKNISTELSNRKLTVKLKDDLDLTSVKTGDSTLNSSVLSITGGPSVTADGIAAGSKAITGVAMNVVPLDTDAVNVAYLNSQIDANKTRFYSVNNNDPLQGNYDNKGATGTNALAAGVNALASGSHSTSVGFQNDANATNSTAVGFDNTANAAHSSVLGFENISETNAERSSAMGFKNETSGVNSTAVGFQNISSAENASAFGFKNTASGSNSSAVGFENTGSGSNSTAVGFQNKGSGSNSSAVGFENTGSGSNSTAVGFQNKGSGSNSSAVGFQNTASDPNSSSVGFKNTASGSNSSAVGFENTGSGSNSTAVGFKNTAGGRNSSAVGFENEVSADNGAAFGFTNKVTSERGLAAGFRSESTGVDALAIGSQAKAIVDESVAIGNESGASGYRSVSLGSETSATGSEATALGSASQAFAGSTTAVGFGARADQYGATAVGVNSRAWGQYSAAFGQTAVANNAYDVALGSGSETDTAVATEDIIINGKTYDFAGITPLSTVSVGKVGSERTITNVAAGQISDTSTDAINGSQLFQTNQAIGDLTQSIVNAIGGVEISNGGITKPSYTIGEQTFSTISEAINFMADGWYLGTGNTPANPIPGGGEGGSTTTPPAEPTSPEAPIQVRPGDTLTLVGGDNINITQDTEAKEVTIATDPNLVVNSVTAGQTVMDDSGVSVGANVHLGETGLIITGGPSVTTGGINAGNLLITNVAAGSIGTESTDAINGSQIHAINTSVASAFGGGSVVQEDGTVSAPSYTVGNKDTVVNNVGDAIDILNQGWTLTAGGNDSQVQSGDVVSLSNNDGNIVITHAADSGAVAFDLNENITVNNVNATTVNASTVRAGNTVINNSGVSFVNEAGEPVGPSMRPDGIDAGGYPIANVAPGVRPTDAANMGQLSQAVNTINHRIDRVESRADAGTAAAMAVAGLGQPYRPGQSMVSLGSGLWRGETGYALGISTLSGNGKWLIKGAATSSSRGGVGGSASINYAW